MRHSATLLSFILLAGCAADGWVEVIAVRQEHGVPIHVTRGVSGECVEIDKLRWLLLAWGMGWWRCTRGAEVTEYQRVDGETWLPPEACD